MDNWTKRTFYNSTDPEYVSGSSPGVGKAFLNAFQDFIIGFVNTFNSHVTTFNTHKSRHATGGADALTASDIGAAPTTVEITGTLSSSSWVGTSAPYTQTVTMSGVKTTTKGFVGISESATADERVVARRAKLHLTSKGTDNITITADGDKPSINVPIVLEIVG